jgi:hypothetical protein
VTEQRVEAGLRERRQAARRRRPRRGDRQPDPAPAPRDLGVADAGTPRLEVACAVACKDEVRVTVDQPRQHHAPTEVDDIVSPRCVGMQVSHGCVRLYPEDIERLFPLVPVGVPGEFTYQPVKAGVRDGAVYLEAHSDIYGHAPAPYREAIAALGRAGLADRADEPALLRALQDRAGMPVRLTSEPDGGAVVPASARHEFEDGRVPDQDDGKAADD